MKSFSFIHILLFLLAALVCKCAHAQDYVVTLKGDTLKGKVKPIDFGADKKVMVVDGNKNKTTFPIFKIRSFVYDGEIYHPVKNDKGYVFMKLIKSGYLSLYAFRMENQSYYDGRFLVKLDGGRLEVPNLGFKKSIIKFLSDCGEVTSQVDNGSLGKNDLEEIVSKFNACINNKTSKAKHVVVVSDEVQPIETPSAWLNLEEKVKSKADFEGKADALEMINEIKNKVGKKEKIPNFLSEGLKSILAKTDLSSDLENALKAIEQ